MRSAISLAFVGMMFLVGEKCAAFPIEPVPLRQLIEKSDLIVLAIVEPYPRQQKNARSPFAEIRGTSPAHLRPIMLLKGKVSEALIQVHFQPNLICPSPPEFRVGGKVLAFLKRNTPDEPYRDRQLSLTNPILITNGFETVGLSYGAKEVSEQEGQAYSETIKEYLQLTAEHVGEAKLRMTTEWLVKCVENRHAGWDAAYELCRRENWRGKKVTNEFAPHLTESHMARLSNVLFQAEFLTGREWPLIRMFQDTAKSQVFSFLLRYLQRANLLKPPMDPVLSHSDSFPSPWLVSDAMHLVADLLASKEAKAMAESHKRTAFFEAQQRVTAVSKFLAIVNTAPKPKELLQH
jgi:hypothetical protein